MKPWLAASIASLLVCAAWLPSRADEVTVFRCTDDAGAVSLQDTPCPPRSREQVRSLTRPRDAAPVVAPAAAAPVAPTPEVVPQAPAPRLDVQPLFECVRHDGERYESASGIPQRHWVPLWVLGMDPRAPPSMSTDVGRPRPPPPSFRPGPGAGITDPALAYAAGTWVEDACYRLSAAEACARRSAHLADLLRRRGGAQQRERDRLRNEIATLRAQLRQECGA